MSYLDDAKSYLGIGRKEVPGLLFCVLVALLSYILTRGVLLDNGPRVLDSALFENDPLFSTLFKVGPIVLALLIGLLVNLSPLNAGGAYAGRFVLRLAIVLMGARVTVDVLSKASPAGIAIILAVMAFTMWLSFFIGNRMKMGKDVAALIGTGNGVCGVSACLSVAPVIGAKPHNTHAVIGVISVLGLIGVFAVPWIATIAGLSAGQAEVLIGGSLHEIGNVIPAADLYHIALGGEDVTALVLAYKMIRVAMLVVVAYVLGRMFQSGDRASAGKRLPGFLIAFVIVAALISLLIHFVPVEGGEIRSAVVSSSASLLTVAMAGVGLSMDLRQTVRVGRKLLPMATLVWVAQLALLLVLTILLV